MKLIFVRHGQTDWNKVKKLMGRTDIDLNEEGRAQAAAVVQALGTGFDALYSSPLKRAYQTAQAIAEHAEKPIIVDERLSERDFGSLQGKSWVEIQAETGIDMKAITKMEEYDFRPYGGESAGDVKERLLSFLDDLKTKPYARVCIVCHSGIISMMRHLYPNDVTDHISNTSINEFELAAT